MATTCSVHMRMPIAFKSDRWTDAHMETQLNILLPNDQMWGSLTLTPNHYNYYLSRSCPQFSISLSLPAAALTFTFTIALAVLPSNETDITFPHSFCRRLA